MPNPAFVGSTSATGTSTASLVIPYSGAAGDLFVLGTLDSGAGIVGISSIVDNGGNVWTVSYVSDSQPGYDFNFNFVTATNPFTSITVTLTGSVSKIFAALGEYSNYSPSVTNVVRDFHQPAITEQNDSVAGNALISFYVAYGGGAFTGPDIGGTQRQSLGPGVSPFTGCIALVDNMTPGGGATSETTASPALSFSEYGFFSASTPPPLSVSPLSLNFVNEVFGDQSGHGFSPHIGGGGSAGTDHGQQISLISSGTWSVQSAPSWLLIQPRSGSGNTNITINLLDKGLPRGGGLNLIKQGVYSGTIVFTDGSNTASVNVQYTVGWGSPIAV